MQFNPDDDQITDENINSHHMINIETEKNFVNRIMIINE